MNTLPPQGLTISNSMLAPSCVTSDKVNFLGIPNLFNPATVTTGYYVSPTTGNIGANGSYSASDYIPVTAGLAYKLLKSTYNTAFYNSSKTFISGSGIGVPTTSFTAPVGSAYVRLTILNSDVSTAMMVQGNTLPLNFTAYGAQPSGFLIPEAMNFINKSVNLFSKFKAIAESYVSPTTGNIGTATNNTASDYFPVIAGNVYTSNMTIYNIAYYDANKAFISGVALNATSFTPPANATYARINFLTSFLGTATVVFGNTLPTSYQAGGYVFPSQYITQNFLDWNKAGLLQWQGKSGNAVGDSVTAFNYYPPIVQSSLNLASYTNYGVANTTVAVNSGAVVGQSFVERVPSITDQDLWTVMGGYNDWLYGTPLGDITSTDTSTFYGALKAICINILGRSNSPKLLLITPLQSNRNGASSATPSHTMLDFVQAIKDVAQYYSIPYLDLYSIGGINPLNMGTLTSDGVHPTQAGTNLFAPKIVKALQDIR